MVVSATRAPREANTLSYATDVFGGDTLRDAPTLTLDDTLRRSAAFSLFRRSGSLTANPTAQGVSLRGIGPSGASRALVLFDGVPVNDPFGGWVAWTKLPTGNLDRVEIVRGGGSAAWGGASLGGVVQLFTAPLPVRSSGENVTHMVTNYVDEPGATSGAVRGMVGDFRTRAGEVGATVVSEAGRDAFRVDAAAFATDGVRLVRDPGVIDVAADSEYQRGSLGWTHRIGETTTLTTAVRAWEEERGNGTPYQRNGSEELFGSATLAGAPTDGPAWSLAIYGQDQDYRSTFSAVNAARDDETPASDQYSVPATAAGFSAQATWGEAAADAANTTLGLDARHVDGETREYFFYNGSDFTRERRAGGAQTVAGAFGTHVRPVAEDVTLTLGARVDSTRRTDGFRREVVRATGVELLDETYEDQDDVAFSPSLGLAWRATKTLTARAAAYSAYRTPTLNELYRPFRIGAITTQANPELEPETLVGGEAGLDYAATGGRHGGRVTVFQNRLTDAVGNVTVDPTTRERRNLDDTRVRGVELGAYWRPVEAVRLDADYLLSDARVRSGGVGSDGLDGKRLAQVPRHTVSAGAAWQAARVIELDLRVRWVSEQFEDDLNTLPLASATRVDFAARYDFAPRWRLTLAVENLFDAEIETARTAAGLVSVAPPRLARVEVEWRW
ncbi:MAG: TonB-dependent receptor [Burkholderiales bacterium]|nr:TonB-dependent receptor [Opitutaceae bacterium]